VSELLKTSIGRGSVVAILGGVTLYVDRVHLSRGSRAKPRSMRRTVAGAALAFAGPAVVTASQLRGRSTVLAPPPSPLGKSMLAGYLLTGVLAEELLWRKILTYPLRAVPSSILAAVSSVGFVLAHLPRDGRRGAAIHTANTMSWTASALTTRSLRWSVLSHWAYNWLALSLKPAAQPPLTRSEA
jgi:membrane protease YdiL (CAAX protease family)